jgi:transposase
MSVTRLEPWIGQARDRPVAAEVRAIAAGLVRDWPCVRATMVHAQSNGRAEGHVKRLKMIKRKMYGRAELDLLRIRVIGR